MVAMSASVAQSTTRNQKGWFTGGTLYSDSTYYYRVFDGVNQLAHGGGNTYADYLLVSGGGGGGSSTLSTDYLSGSGGGAGSVFQTFTLLYGYNKFAVIVGAGGATATKGSSTSIISYATSAPSGILTVTLWDGGGYGRTNAGAGGPSFVGSTGGGAPGGAAGTQTLSGYGNLGGSGVSPGYGASAGGGGAGAVGGSTTNAYQGGSGGTGTSAYSSWGSVTSTGHNVSGTYYFGGGGGGGGAGAYGTPSIAAASNGGGGAGGAKISGTEYIATAGLAKTGGGGGGAGASMTTTGNNIGKPGGSGTFIIRYLKSDTYQ